LNSKDLASVLNCFASKLDNKEFSLSFEELGRKEGSIESLPRPELKKVRLALPDGHQLPPTTQLLKRVGLNLSHYSVEALDYHPSVDLDWLDIKVIRPQDMPLQVANGNFDLAITGRDWLLDHVYRFPSSPVVELLDLGFGKVKVVAATSQEMPVSTIEEVKQLLQKGKLSTLRVASEYVNISDKYLCDHHVSPYKLILTWGTSEAFLPEDADLLIDNTQTGRTMAEHNLKIIDTLCESTACLIGNKESIVSPDRKEEIDFLIQMMRGGLA
jgi:ATP phosphoribosyltransferase